MTSRSIVIDGLLRLPLGGEATAGEARKLHFTIGMKSDKAGLFGGLAPLAVPEPGGRASLGVAGLSIIGMTARRRQTIIK